VTIAQVTEIYTDGACAGNPGQGGWGVVLQFEDGSVQELGGSEPETTNNRMEMQAAVSALEFLHQILPNSTSLSGITLYTDSEYLQKGITQWVQNWKRKGWKTSTGGSVLNQDLWQRLDELNQGLGNSITWKYVRGHAGNPGNERCDTIAKAFSKGRPVQLRQVLDLTASSRSAVSRSTDPQLNPSIEQRANLALEAASNHDLSEFSQMALQATKPDPSQTLKSQSVASESSFTNLAMADSVASVASPLTPTGAEALEALPNQSRVNQLRDLIETLRIADEVADKGYLITSSELADLMDVNASAVTSRGEQWVWRNWVVSRVRREGNQILWQLERVD